MSATEMAPDPPAPETQLDLLLIGRHPFGGHPPLGDWQMARALHARGHRILFVDPPHRVRPDVRRRARRAPVERLGDRLWVLRSAALPRAARRGGARLSDPWIGRQVARVSGRLFGAPPVLLTFDPLRGPLDAVPRRLTVYWRRDRLGALEVAPDPTWLAERDRQLLERADLVSCTARPLVADAAAVATGQVIHIPNGCEAAHFAAPRERPAAMPTGELVVGFVGGAYWRLDTSLLEQVARLRPGWTILLVGDELPTQLADVPNVRAVPYVPYEEVPAWMQHLDVGLIPYDLDLPFNHGSLPIKAYEYLAAGVPVVSTSLPSLEGMEAWVHLADGGDAFVAAIERALRGGADAAARVAFAASNTWLHRAAELEHALVERLTSPPSPGTNAPMSWGHRRQPGRAS